MKETDPTNIDSSESAARSAIQSLAARYVLSADTKDHEGLANCFTEDATLVAGSVGTFNGRAKILELMQGAPTDGPKARHFTSTHHIDFTGPGSARGVQYFQVITEIGLDHWGIYEDEYKLIDGQWLFQVRNGIVEDSVANSVLFGSGSEKDVL